MGFVQALVEGSHTLGFTALRAQVWVWGQRFEVQSPRAYRGSAHPSLAVTEGEASNKSPKYTFCWVSADVKLHCMSNGKRGT